MLSFIGPFEKPVDVHVGCELVKETENKTGHSFVIPRDEESNSQMNDQIQKEMEEYVVEAEEEKRKKNPIMQQLLSKLNQKWVENKRNCSANQCSKRKHSNARKELKEKLKRKVRKRRSIHMRMHRKKFGKNDEYYIREKLNSQRMEDDIQYANEEKEEKEEENDNEEMEEMEEMVDIVSDKENKELMMNETEMADLDFEGLAKMHERQNANEIPKEILQYLDMAAEEENENGTVMDNNSDDEHYETFGVIRDLLATKHDCYMDDTIEHENKRKKIHQKLIEMEDQQNLELMEKAFIEGKYRAIQALNKKKNNRLLTMNDNYSSSLNGFRSRNSEWSLKNPEDYLTTDTAMNEYCVYDKNGEFNDVFTIRMKIMEWKMRMDTKEDDDIIDDESFINSNMVNMELVSTLDSKSIDILHNIRQNNHKKKTRNKRNKKESESTDFSNFFKENTIIPKISRQNSSSFLESHCKQIERDKKMILQSTDSTFSSNSNHSTSNHFVFSSLSNTNQTKGKKRKFN